MVDSSGPVFRRPDGQLEAVGAVMNYLEPGVTEIWTYRNAQGSDTEFFGGRFEGVNLLVRNGRDARLSLDKNGFELIPSKKEQHIDYYSQEQILKTYYPECEALVREAVGGAARVVAFDHNIRCVV